MSIDRYHRQQRFEAVGERGQERIGRARVLVVGVGALGSVAADLLARAGVGLLRIVDRDVVEWTNLQRQSLYTEQDAREGVAKVQAAARQIARINSQITVEPIATDVVPSNCLGSMAGVWEPLARFLPSVPAEPYAFAVWCLRCPTPASPRHATRPVSSAPRPIRSARCRPCRLCVESSRERTVRSTPI